MRWSLVIGAALLFFAFGLKPLIHKFQEGRRSAEDTAVGQLPILSPEELGKAFGNTRSLIIGGTRGIGRGIARAIVAAGGDVIIVGRSAASGASAVDYLKLHTKSPSTQQVTFLQGDLGTQQGAKTLVKWLETAAKTEGRYDYLITTAAVFPNWDSLLNEDGLERGHAIMVLGRYILYRHMDLFMREGARVLNVAASGQMHSQFDPDFLTAKRNVTGLIESVLNMASSHELMLIALQDSKKFHKTTRVSTHPGVIATELLQGQGVIADVFGPIFAAIVGISEEECGLRQASILASPRLRKGGLTYVDEDMIGRVRSPDLQANVDRHLTWLTAWLNERAEL